MEGVIVMAARCLQGGVSCPSSHHAQNSADRIDNYLFKYWVSFTHMCGGGGIPTMEY